jgi:hypothetical protein
MLPSGDRAKFRRRDPSTSLGRREPAGQADSNQGRLGGPQFRSARARRPGVEVVDTAIEKALRPV